MRLVVLERPESLVGAYQQEEFDLEFDENMPVIRIGRQLTNDITLLDFSVSRQHVELSPKAEGILVHDLNSSNGTYINDKQLPSKGEAVLFPGDKLRLGKALLQLEPSRNAKITESLNLLDAALEQSRQRQVSQAVAPPQPRLEDLFMPPQPFQAKFEDQFLALEDAKQTAETVRADYKSALKETQAIPPEARPRLFPETLPISSLSNPYATAEVAAVPPEAQMFPFQDASALLPPEQVAEKLKERRQPPRKPGNAKGIWLVTLLIIILLIASVVLIGASLWVFSGSSASSPTVVPLPNATFSGATRTEQVLGLALTVPDDWKRVDAETSKVVFNFPDSTLAAFTVEKPPSSSIPQGTISPEEAVRQYLANVRRVGQNVRVLINPSATFLKEGTKAYAVRVIFSTNTAPIVKDYIVYAVSFNCADSLYFITIGDEETAFRNSHKQNLEATLNGVGCR
jgi:pSer/pThr/pTyr-binding forkhead associated (FHA) protein